MDTLLIVKEPSYSRALGSIFHPPFFNKLIVMNVFSGDFTSLIQTKIWTLWTPVPHPKNNFDFFFIKIEQGISFTSGIYNYIMYLIRVRNELWWIFNMEKRSQLFKTMRLSTHIDIFDEKNFSKLFFGMGSKSIFFLN